MILVTSVIIAASLATIGAVRVCCPCRPQTEAAFEHVVEDIVKAETGVDIAPLVTPLSHQDLRQAVTERPEINRR